ncbi:MAG: peptide MFS transporter [Pirellulales bacterium]
MSTSAPSQTPRTVFGHPAGLFTLFFAEMWERFSFYGMRALLTFYMIKGFLGYGDSDAYAVYGAYCSMVYMTPFIGGMLADRLLGSRRAVIVGAVLMVFGEAFLMIPNQFSFFTGLGLLIAGNGFFKPNISTIVGSLYPKGSVKRDGGFTIFYMGINLGAAMSPLLCGFVGQKYGWHWGFGLATLGMLFGLAVFANWQPPGDAGAPPDRARLKKRPVLITQAILVIGALSAATALLGFHPDNPFSIAVNVLVAIALLVAAAVACFSLHKGEGGLINLEWGIYLGTLLALVLFVLLVSGFAPFTVDHRPMALIPDSFIDGLKEKGDGLSQVLAVLVKESSRPAGLVLMLCGLVAVSYIGYETVRLDKIPRERMYVVLILTFFSMLFFAFFEQAGSSISNFTDRNVDRVFGSRAIAADEVGQTIEIQPTQAQLGYHNGDQLFTLDKLDKLRAQHQEAKEFDFTISWKVAKDNVGMGIASSSQEIPASTFQSVNAIFIIIFGLVFSALWTLLAYRGLEPNTCVKFALGLLQVGLGFLAFWYGAFTADSRGMVALGWLFLGYLLHTTGELCLSPVGLSMITKLAPARLVSTVMGTWFLASAFAQFLAAIIAQFTDVTKGKGSKTVIPAPLETVNQYGSVFLKVAICAVVSGLICLALAPLLKRWMHPEAPAGGQGQAQ